MNFVLERLTQPEMEVVTLAEMKRHLRLFSSVTDEDADITALIVAAREWVEDYTGRVLVDQTPDARSARGVARLPAALQRARCGLSWPVVCSAHDASSCWFRERARFAPSVSVFDRDALLRNSQRHSQFQLERDRGRTVDRLILARLVSVSESILDERNDPPHARF